MPTDPRERLKSFADLGDDWNKYGGEKITQEAIDAALKIVDSFPDRSVFVFPTVAGGVEIVLEIKSDGELSTMGDDD